MITLNGVSSTASIEFQFRTRPNFSIYSGMVTTLRNAIGRTLIHGARIRF